MKLISGNPYIKEENGLLFLDQLLINDLLDKNETPFIVFLENRITENINTFQNIFEKIFGKNGFSCFYSLKANYLPEIVKTICSQGIGAEIIGLPELNLVLKLGIPKNKILLGGPYLSNILIYKAIENDIKEIIIYNLNDIKKVNYIAEKNNKIQDLCIRVKSERYNSKLGIEINEKNILKLKSIASECKNINITSILSHYGTQMNNINLFKKNIEIIINNLKKLKNIDLNIENINLGGGFPEASVMKKSQLEYIASKIKCMIDDSNIEYKKIYFEPGRYFVGDSGLFLTEIINVSDDRWIFLNIGNHICPKFAKASLRFYNITQINSAHKYKTSIAGIIPTDQDVLAKNYFFTNNLKEEDKVLVTNVGAYTLTFSNRFPYQLPKIFIVKNNECRLIFDPLIDKDITII